MEASNHGVVAIDGSTYPVNEAPGENTGLVQENVDHLKTKFNFLNKLADGGKFANLAGNAAALDADILIKTQNVSFSILGVCDSISLIATNLACGATNILEKLHIAFLYLLDDFPDMASTNIDALQKDISSMKAIVEKALRKITETLGKLQDALDLVEGRDRESSEVQLCRVSLEETWQCVRSVEDAVGLFQPLLDKWLKECQDVVKPGMDSNIRRSKGLNQEQVADYWKSLPFKEEVMRYLCRWRALKVVCEEIRPTLKRTRYALDHYYTENLLPKEAVQKAWADAAEIAKTNKKFALKREEHRNSNSSAGDDVDQNPNDDEKGVINSIATILDVLIESKPQRRIIDDKKKKKNIKRIRRVADVCLLGFDRMIKGQKRKRKYGNSLGVITHCKRNMDKTIQKNSSVKKITNELEVVFKKIRNELDIVFKYFEEHRDQTEAITCETFDELRTKYKAAFKKKLPPRSSSPTH